MNEQMNDKQIPRSNQPETEAPEMLKTGGEAGFSSDRVHSAVWADTVTALRNLTFSV